MSRRRVVKKPEPVVRTVDKRLILILLAVLAIGTLAIYFQVYNHDFLQFDDVEYVTNNYNITTGINPASIRWAFSLTGYCSNWHPLTWISHMVDYQLFGLKFPGGHHLMNVLFHILSTLLLFLALVKMTGSVWKSAFVAALFAIHPVHIESVAWVAERKDVLSTFFWMLTLLAYANYVQSRGSRKIALYAGMIAAYALGLLAKPMLVTLPITFLLLDWWPLGRLRSEKSKPSQMGQAILEKIPLFLMAAGSSYMTYKAQSMGGSVSSDLTLPMRLSNAVVSYATYIYKMVWPANLSIVYPHMGPNIPQISIVIAVVLLAAITAGVVMLARRYPYLGAGWVWYIVTLIPVIGLVQVGEQSRADRYTYIPLTGLFFIIAWGVPDLVKRFQSQPKEKSTVPEPVNVPLAATAGAVLLALAISTALQLNWYWKNTETLFTHAIAVTPPNITAQINLGAYLEKQGRRAEGIEHYKKALEANPGHVRSLNLLASAYFAEEKFDDAIRIYKEALKYADDYRVNSNLAAVYNATGKPAEAIPYLQRALALKPDFAQGHYNLGRAYAMLGRWNDSINEYQQSLSINPSFAQVHIDYAIVLMVQKKYNEALPEFRRGITLEPNIGEYHNWFGELLFRMQNYEAAMSEFQEAQRLGVRPNPKTLAAVAAKLGRK